MVKTWFSILCVSVVLVVAGCGVPRDEYVALETKYTQAQAENKTANDKILKLNKDLLDATATLKQLKEEKETLATERDTLKARVTTLTADVQAAKDDAEKSKQAASQAFAELKTTQATIKTIEAREARVNAQMAQVKAIAEQIQIDLKSLVKWLDADTMAADHPLNGNGRSAANTVGHDATAD